MGLRQFPGWVLFEDFYGYVRTDFGAESTPGTKLLIGSLSGCVPLDIDLIAQRDQLLRAGDGAESAPLTSQFVYLNSSHI